MNEFTPDICGPEDNPGVGRVAAFRDPFGHRWFLNQPLPG